MKKSESNKKKTGPLSPQEREWILANAPRMSTASIAEKLNRTEKLITNYIAKHYVPLSNEDDPGNVEKTIRANFRNSPEWDRLCMEFTTGELAIFEEKWVAYRAQFKNDVLPSEETQILLSIKLLVLMSRNLIERRKAGELMEDLEKRRSSFMRGKTSEELGPEDRDYLSHLEDTIQSIRMGETNKVAEYTKLNAEHIRLMKDLKATRDQRFREVESSKISFLGLIKTLQQRDQAETMGRQSELVRMAADKEFERLSEYHEYGDGLLDKPFLSSETVDDEE